MFSFYDYISLWNYVFFDPQPASAIAVTRICIGLCSFFTFYSFLISKNVGLFFGPAGIVSNKQFVANRFLHKKLCVFKCMLPTIRSVYIVLWVGLISSVCMCLGFITPLFTAMSYVCFTSLCHRNPWIFHSGDSLLRIVLFFLIFSRAGCELSIDCCLYGTPMINNLGHPWCERLIQLLLCCMYIKTISWKLYNKVWLNGEALYFPLKMKSMIRFDIPDCLLPLWLIKIGTWIVLFSQSIIGASFFVKDLRLLSVLLGIFLHMCFHIFLRLDLFSFIVISCLLIYVPNEYIISIYSFLLTLF
jgi:hypothetical protein